MSASETYDLSLLELSQRKWEHSKPIQTYYASIYREILELRSPGRSLEIGSGCGFIKDLDPSVITSDVSKTRFVEQEVSAYSIHELEQNWDNILALDVFHHLTEPLRFLESATEALNFGGRILLCEPAATLFGQSFYRLFHQEPCLPDSINAPYVFESNSTDEYSNMGIGTALFCRDREEANAILARLGLSLRMVRHRDVIGYPMTGGFSKPALLPASLLKFLLRSERLLPQWLLSRIGLRMLIAIEKT